MSKKKKKKVKVEAEMIFSILMSLSVHSNLLVLVLKGDLRAIHYQRPLKYLLLHDLHQNELYMLCLMDSNWIMQEYLGLNPDWFNYIYPLSVKNLNALLHSNPSKIFPQIASNEMSR